MKRRDYDSEAQEHGGGRSYLAQPGKYRVVEDDTPIAAGLSYLAANEWAAKLRAAVSKFIEDNEQECSGCECKWIITSSHKLNECPYCGRQSNQPLTLAEEKP